MIFAAPSDYISSELAITAGRRQVGGCGWLAVNIVQFYTTYVLGELLVLTMHDH